jgi:hypothetical protein
MVDARRPSASGVFYPDARELLASTVRALLDGAVANGPSGSISHLEPSGFEHRSPPRFVPKAMLQPRVRSSRVRAIVAPHGRLGVCGAVAAAAWAQVIPRASQIQRVVVIGPAHHMIFSGIAAPFAEAFETPLGTLAVDRVAIESARRWPHLVLSDDAHEREHSIEVQLPFAQTVLDSPLVVPLLVGEASEEEVATVMEAVWGDATLLVVSTDLSQYYDAATASRLDLATALAVETLDGRSIGVDQACGWVALRALLRVARARDLRATRIQLSEASLWDDGATLDEVTGFGAFVVS